MRSVYIVLILAWLVFGCAGVTQHGSQEESPQKASTTIADPLDLPDDLTIVPSKFPIKPDTVSSYFSSADKGRTKGVSDSSIAAYESYRIQIFQSRIYGPAVRELSVAQELFDQRVWLDYEVPYYKVRVGDFPNRESADAYLPKARQAGYDAAWVVRVNINVETLETGFKNETSISADSSVNPKVPPGQIDDSTRHPNH